MSFNKLNIPLKPHKYKQGLYKPINPKKYAGDSTKIIFRSSYELKFMQYCDLNGGVINWRTEEFSIPYVSPKDNRVHRYFIDFQIMIKTKQGTEIHLVEIKPSSQLIPPKPNKKATKSHINEIITYAVNDAKFKAARKYCEERKWKFTILNEFDLGLKEKK